MEHSPETTAPEKETIPPLEANLDEKSAYFDRHPEDIRPNDLNNLHLWLPGSGYVKLLEKMLDRKRISFMPEGDTRHSARWLNQTLREYIQTIEGTLVELPEVKHVLDQQTAATPIRNDALIPLYMALREKGYTHYDLVV